MVRIGIVTVDLSITLLPNLGCDLVLCFTNMQADFPIISVKPGSMSECSHRRLIQQTICPQSAGMSESLMQLPVRLERRPMTPVRITRPTKGPQLR